MTKRTRLTVLLATAGTVVPLALAGTASAATGVSNDPNPPIKGTIAGFTNGDFAYLDALNVGSLSLAQLTLAQSAAGVSNGKLQTVNTLGEDLLTTKSASGHNAYGRAAGVSLNLGQGSASVPQVQLTQAEVASPPPGQVKTARVLNLPLAPIANVDVQPDIATSNTKDVNNFCVLGSGHPISAGQATIANAEVLPITSSQAVLAVDGTVQNNSLEELAPNASGNLGLSSATLLHTANVQLFKGIPGAEIDIKVINPLVLQAFAGGDSSSFVTYGSGDKQKDVLSITAGGQTATLTAEQLLGSNGLTIDVDGLLRVQIGGKPTIVAKGVQSGQDSVSATADLISVQVISLTPTNTASSLGGPLAPILNPILNPVLTALDPITTQLDNLLTSLGIKVGVDLRVGHFEANADVPAGGIQCNIPVSKTPSSQTVTAGNPFTVTLSASNPYDCTLTNVKFEDKISAESGNPTWNVKNTAPNADSGSSNNDLVWSGLGDIKPGGHQDVVVTLDVPADSPSGELEDTAIVTGTCASGNGPGTANIHLNGTVTLHGPTVAGITPHHVTLPNTGSSPWLPIGGGLLAATGLGLVALRRRSITG